MNRVTSLIIPLFAFVGACRGATPGPGEVTAVGDGLDRSTFNRLAAELALPLFWTSDDDGRPDPSEIAVLWGYDETTQDDWIQEGSFTPKFDDALRRIQERQTTPALSDPRLAAVRRELAQGRPTLILTTLPQASAQDAAIVEHVLAAAKIVERIHARQNGVLKMAEKIPADDTMSRMLFHRNQSPWCEAPQTEAEPACAGLADSPKKISGLYPRAIQENDPKFCDTLAARPDGESLMHQFYTVAEGADGKLTAVPYHVAFKSDVEAVAKELRAAASAITNDDETAFRAYLNAAANGFVTDEWEKADEAWAAMNADNSKWYLRIGPDETYFEPCSRKAGYHVSFARIDQSSREWQQRLDPVKNEMEVALAKLAGKPYEARQVDFDLPDFISIIINAGDARRGLSATIGQSLPNWGPVANEGRGRTVAMMNVNTDPDSVDAVERQAKSVFCAETFKSFVRDPDSLTMSTVLHEAAHNLGPAHEYKVDGKTDDDAFGGPLASTMEELKAETASYYFADWLATKGIITKEAASIAHVRDLVWGFGHISRGMYDADGRPKAYSHLSAIHLGYFIDAGAAAWNPTGIAANGTDKGCLELDLAKFPPVVEKLMTVVAGIKARGDRKQGEALVAKYVDGSKPKPLLEEIKARWLREPQPSFVYSIEMKRIVPNPVGTVGG